MDASYMTQRDYDGFLRSKRTKVPSVGRRVDESRVHPMLFPFQRDVLLWALRKGRAAVFLDTGMGKTFIQLEWARLLGERTLIVAPLSVARQTVREGKKIDVEVKYVRSQDEADGVEIAITNYEMLDAFDLDTFGAIVLDESSVLKAITSKTRRKIISRCQNIPYRLACTATPAPNDYIELGNHAEFLGVCTRSEMLAMFFINANKQHTVEIGGEIYQRKGSNKGGTEWRLKHHAEDAFFRWLASWAMTMTKPSDLGYDDDGFILPPLEMHVCTVDSGYIPDDQLFFTKLKGVSDRHRVRRETLHKRAGALAEIVNADDDQWIIWCGLNEESTMATDLVDGAVEVKGNDSSQAKADAFESFQDGDVRVLVTKGRIGGFGMNFQNAHKMAFLGLNDSWELWYQCIRREWRFGQSYPVEVWVMLSDVEHGIYRNVQRKEALATRLREGLIESIRGHEKGEIEMKEDNGYEYSAETREGAGWTAMMGDSCERLSEIDDNSIDLSVYSPPFADLYTYTDSERDLGNSRGKEEFFGHYGFIIREVLRVTKPGRMTCVHTSDIPAMAQKDGYIGIKDFPGDVIRAYECEGWTFVGRAFVQKNPQAQAIRTKSKALLFVQLRKDSSDSRPALVDQILMFRKPGDNAVPVMPVANGELDNETWIEWAHGIWLGIQESDTLQFTRARDTDDEKHICPLQLGVIERCIKLYSNPGETVLTPFMGIGSEVYMALKLGRKAIGIELKESYFKVAVQNAIKAEADQMPLFAGMFDSADSATA